MLCLTSYLLAQLTAHKDYARINVKPAGERQGMGWGFDCLCWPWGRALD